MTLKTPEKILYTASAHAIGGRDGSVKTDDGVIDLAVRMPAGLGGKGGGTNPEQLFASGYAACFGSALGHVARAQKIELGTVEIDAKVGIGPHGQGFALAVELIAHLPNLPREQAEALVAAAHEVCPYSNATRGNVPVTITVA